MNGKTELKIIHFAVLVVGIVAAVYFLASPGFHEIIVGLKGLGYLGVFITGIFFSSMLTTVPATITLFLFGSTMNPLIIAPIAAAGALISDYFIFSFVKYKISHHYGVFDKIILWFRERKFVKYIKRHKVLKFSIPLVGALIIASPLPDELGVAILGASKYNTKHFFIVAFIMNMVGVLGITYFGSLV